MALNPVIYEGVDDTLESATRVAIAKIPFRDGRDYVVAKVTEWGLQRGGFTNQDLFWVRAIEDEDAAFRTKESGDVLTQAVSHVPPVLFSFLQSDENNVPREFVFELRLEEKIREARRILADASIRSRSVVGTVIPGRKDYNPNWSFHLDPDSIGFFEYAIEVCDANVTAVERRLEEVGGQFLPRSRWCPWSSRLEREVKSRC